MSSPVFNRHWPFYNGSTAYNRFVFYVNSDGILCGGDLASEGIGDVHGPFGIPKVGVTARLPLQEKVLG